MLTRSEYRGNNDKSGEPPPNPSGTTSTYDAFRVSGGDTCLLRKDEAEDAGFQKLIPYHQTN